MKLQFARSDVLDIALTMEKVVVKATRKYWKDFGRDYIKELRDSIQADAFVDDGERQFASERLTRMEAVERALSVLEDIGEMPEDPEQGALWEACVDQLWEQRDALWD